jgi:very-short-patch-repair endonuclease
MSDFARNLRKNQTDTEKLIWSKLRNRQLNGLKFRRQHEVGNYFADFACIELKLIIELDGGQHAEQVLKDEFRTTYLKNHGWTVLRFWNNEAFTNTQDVLEEILRVASTLTPTLSRSRERELTPVTEKL